MTSELGADSRDRCSRLALATGSVPWAFLTCLIGSLLVSGCGPGGHYSRAGLDGNDANDAGASGGATMVDGDDVDSMAAGGGTGGLLIGSGGAGTGGTLPGTGGAVGTGGITPGTGGTVPGTGGMGTGGAATGGTGTGGAALPGTGGAATGGASPGTGGAGTGGSNGTGGSSGPRIISIDFAGGNTIMEQTETAGCKPAPRWNSAAAASGSLTTLTDKDGMVVPAGVAWSAGGGGVFRVPSWTDAAGDVRMMKGYLDPYTASAPATVSVTGLPAAYTSTGYDVYVYVYSAVSSGTRVGRYTIGATTSSVSLTGPTASTFEGFTLAPEGGTGNYVVFRNLRGTSFMLTAAPGTASGTQTRAPVNGLQIVAPSGF